MVSRQKRSGLRRSVPVKESRTTSVPVAVGRASLGAKSAGLVRGSMKFLRKTEDYSTRRGDIDGTNIMHEGRSQSLNPGNAIPPPVPEAFVRKIEKETVPDITKQTPDNVIGQTLKVQGRVEFTGLLRIDGHFEGDLVGCGNIIVGPTAEVVSNLRGLKEVYVEGILIGDCACEKMQIRFHGCVTGNIACVSLAMDPTVVLKGNANVSPREKAGAEDKGKPHASNHRGSKHRPQEDVSSRAPSHASTSALSSDSDTNSIASVDAFGKPAPKTSHSRHKSGKIGSGSGSVPSGTPPAPASTGSSNRPTSSDVPAGPALREVS